MAADQAPSTAATVEELKAEGNAQFKNKDFLKVARRRCRRCRSAQRAACTSAADCLAHARAAQAAATYSKALKACCVPPPPAPPPPSNPSD